MSEYLEVPVAGVYALQSAPSNPEVVIHSCLWIRNIGFSRGWDGVDTARRRVDSLARAGNW